MSTHNIWTASSEFGTYRLCEQQRFRRACASAQSRQNLRCSLIQAVSQEEPSDRKPDPWPLWMAGHAQLKFVMTECSKTQIRLTGLICFYGQLTKLILDLSSNTLICSTGGIALVWMVVFIEMCMFWLFYFWPYAYRLYVVWIFFFFFFFFSFSCY